MRKENSALKIVFPWPTELKFKPRKQEHNKETAVP